MQHPTYRYNNESGREVVIEANEHTGTLQISVLACLPDEPPKECATIRLHAGDWYADDLRAMVYDWATCVELLCEDECEANGEFLAEFLEDDEEE